MATVRYANTIDEHPIYAKRAERDQNGDVIDTTYLKKTDEHVLDVVDKDGTTLVNNQKKAVIPVTDVKVNNTSVVDAHGSANVAVPVIGYIDIEE